MIDKRIMLVALATAALGLQAAPSFSQQNGGAAGRGGAGAGQAMGAQGGEQPGGAQPGRSDPGNGNADIEPRPVPGQAKPGQAQPGQVKPGQGQPGAQPPRAGEPNKNGQAGQNGQEPGADRNRPGTPKASGEAQPNGRNTPEHRGAPPRIGGEQQGRFRQAIHGLGVREVGSINFDVRVGVRIPHEVHLYALPPSIIEVYPDYEGYEFFLVRGTIVVVDPDTFEIVDEFPA